MSRWAWAAPVLIGAMPSGRPGAAERGAGIVGARLEVLPGDLERSSCAAGPWFAVGGEDDLGIDRGEPIERGERGLTVVVQAVQSEPVLPGDVVERRQRVAR